MTARAARRADASAHVAPDGRGFTVAMARCSCSPCWRAWCACGSPLTAHDFTREDAIASALCALADSDERPGFGHAVCEAGGSL